VRYTFYIALPLNIEDVDHQVRKNIKKAEKSGFTWEIATQKVYKEVIECLLETEHRQNFQFRLTTRDLEVAKELLGEEIFRVYLCRDNSGEVASARIILSFPGLRAIDWVAGTKRKFLSEGATQFLIWNALNDLSHQGIKGFDFCGANLPTVSAMKASWGGSLTPYYAVSPLNFRSLIRLSLKYLKQIV
jgi:lipid II:glycine glycyltransferase (peptidoglycan interpeptide bridge formation enzyme)